MPFAWSNSFCPSVLLNQDSLLKTLMGSLVNVMPAAITWLCSSEPSCPALLGQAVLLIM